MASIPGNRLASFEEILHVDLSSLIPVDIQMVDTQEFLGADSLNIEGMESRQVGYAYSFRMRDPEKRRRLKTVRVMELDLSQIEATLPRHQALAILHERLHFVSGLEHSVISPLVRDLSVLMALADSQAKGERRGLTGEELEASNDLQLQLNQLGMPEWLFEQVRVYPDGGGVVRSQIGLVRMDEDVIEAPQSYYVPVDQLTWVDPATAYLLRKKETLNGGRRPPEETKYRFEVASASASVTGETASSSTGARASGALISGQFSPWGRCVQFSAEGKCEIYREVLPLALSVGLGQDNRIQKASITMFRKIRELPGDRFSATCQSSIGNLTYEEFRMNQGQQFTASIFSLGCDSLLRLGHMGHVKLHFDGYLREAGPILGAVSVGRSPLVVYKGEKNKYDIQLPLNGQAGVGIEFWNRVLIEAFGSYRVSGRHASVGAGIYGARLSVDLPKGMFLDGKFTREHFSFTSVEKPGDEGETLRVRNTTLGVGFGFKRDIFGKRGN